MTGSNRPTCSGSSAAPCSILPARRARYSARKVKNWTSRYHEHDPTRPQHSTTVTAIDITLSLPPVTGPRRTSMPRPAGQTRRDKVTAIMASDPIRTWHGHELAGRLGVKTRNLLTQLGGGHGSAS